MCRSDQAGASPGRVSFRRLKRSLQMIVCISCTKASCTRRLLPHPNPIPFMRVPTGARRGGSSGEREGGRPGALLGCPRLGPLGVWCLALLLCRVLAMRCDAMRARSRAKRWLARIPELMACLRTPGSRAGHGTAQLLASAPGNFLQVTPRSRPAVHRRRVYVECSSAPTSVQSSPNVE